MQRRQRRNEGVEEYTEMKGEGGRNERLGAQKRRVEERAIEVDGV